MVLPTRPPMPLRTAVNIAELSNPTYIGEPQYTGAWKGCAYDPELPPQSAPGGIYHTDQVKVEAALVDVVREWSKEVIRGGFHVNQDPEGMIAFSRDWFAQKAAEFAAGPPPPRDYAAEEAARRAAEEAAAAGAREQACCAPWPPCSPRRPPSSTNTAWPPPSPPAPPVPNTT